MDGNRLDSGLLRSFSQYAVKRWLVDSCEYPVIGVWLVYEIPELKQFIHQKIRKHDLAEPMRRFRRSDMWSPFKDLVSPVNCN